MSSSRSELLAWVSTFRLGLKRLSELESFRALKNSNEFCRGTDLQVQHSLSFTYVSVRITHVYMLQVCWTLTGSCVCVGNTCSWLFMSNSTPPPRRPFPHPLSLLTVKDKRLVKHEVLLEYSRATAKSMESQRADAAEGYY